MVLDTVEHTFCFIKSNFGDREVTFGIFIGLPIIRIPISPGLRNISGVDDSIVRGPSRPQDRVYRIGGTSGDQLSGLLSLTREAISQERPTCNFPKWGEDGEKIANESKRG
jgi:hypothetical protein